MKTRVISIMLLAMLPFSTAINNSKYAIGLEDNFDMGDIDYIDPSVEETPANHVIAKLDQGNISGSDNDSFAYLNCTNEYCVSDAEYIEMIEQHIFPSPAEWVLITLHCIVFCVGLVGNALVCVAVYRNRTMRTVTNYFIVNLAVADFMVILFCLPPTVVWDVTQTWFMGTLCCKIVLYFQTVSVAVSVLTLTFISIDRWYAICFPLKFKSTTSRAKTAILVIWILALSFDVPELIVLETHPRFEHLDTLYFTQCIVSWSQESDQLFQLTRTMLLYTIPLLFMSIAYCQIVRVLWKSDNIPGHSETLIMHPNNSLNSSCSRRDRIVNATTESQLRSRRKAAKMLVAVVLMFAVCYFPVHLLNILRLIINIKQTEMTTSISIVSHWLCYANSAVNPVIYNFMSGKFRHAFKRAVLEWCGCNREKGDNREFLASKP